MKSIFFFLFLVFTQILWAQNFTEKTGAPFVGVLYSSIAFSDVNGDGHEDVLITGALEDGFFNDGLTKLYINDGMGNFTEMMDTPFDDVYDSSIAFSDVNGDGHEDVLIAGQAEQTRVAKLYINDGMGNFTEMMDAPFRGVLNSSIAFADVNGDNHPDVLITGLISSGKSAKLYINDGVGNFTEMTGTPFPAVDKGSVAFGDVNGDTHPDVLITGETSWGAFVSELYTNDGAGNFSEVTGTPFDGVYQSSIAFADVDGDNDLDVLITGADNSFNEISFLYINDGFGNFLQRFQAGFDGVLASSISFADVDGDNDPDVLITGSNNSIGNIAKLYINDGAGYFTERLNTPFEGVALGSIAFADVDGDDYPDVLITGGEIDDRIAKLYINDGMVSSTDHLSSGVKLELIPYPNPTSSNRVNVRFESEKMGFTTFNLYDVNGHLLRQQKEFSGIGEQTISIDITSLSPGSYFIQLDKGKRKGTATFVVQ